MSNLGMHKLSTHDDSCILNSTGYVFKIMIFMIASKKDNMDLTITLYSIAREELGQ